MWFRQDTPREALQHLVSFNNDDGRIDLFGLDPFGAVWHRAELVLGLGWGPWHFLGGPGLQTLVASQNQDGRLELFATRRDSTVWHAWQTSPGGAWSPWVLFFTPADLCPPETRSGSIDDEVRQGSVERPAGRGVGPADGAANPSQGRDVFGVRCNSRCRAQPWLYWPSSHEKIC
jgi:hypothetical protein